MFVAIFGNERIGGHQHDLLGEDRDYYDTAITPVGFTMIGASFPMIFEEKYGKGKILVEVYKLSDKAIAALDLYHGNSWLSERKKVNVKFSPKETMEAWIYIANPKYNKGIAINNAIQNDKGVWSWETVP